MHYTLQVLATHVFNHILMSLQGIIFKLEVWWDQNAITITQVDSMYCSSE